MSVHNLPPVFPEPAGTPDLIITGERYRGRFLVWVDGRSAPLTCGSYALLWKLLAHRAASGPHVYISDQLCPVAIHRLRTALGAPGKANDAYIQTGVGREYRLRPDLQLGIAADDSIPWAVVGRETLEKGRAACVEVPNPLTTPTRRAG